MTDKTQSRAAKADAIARRISGNIAAQMLDTAQSRVPDVARPPLPQVGARAYLRAARREYGLKNRRFNRATRRQLAREVNFA